jgi:hypothetical protein
MSGICSPERLPAFDSREQATLGLNTHPAEVPIGAGFPQGGAGLWTFPPNNLVARSSDRVDVPTLSELIDACADNFEQLEKVVNDLGAFEAGHKWQAVAQFNHTCGATPEEAVARLWLTLNRKS